MYNLLRIHSLVRFLTLITFLSALSAQAQRQRGKVEAPRVGSSIVDDSTRNVYGPKTTRRTTEEEIFKGKPTYQPLDTAVNSYARWTYVQRFNNFYQDLGVMGTALHQIFPSAPETIGATSGFTAYAPYFATQEPIYFDTKSPYSRMHLVWGGKGRAMTTVEYSRNINPRWNFGFNYRPILVEKQIQSFANNDIQTTSHYYDFYTTYKSKSDRYKLLFNFRRIRHRVNETGGVAMLPGTPPDEIYNPNAKPRFSGTETEEFRSSFHLFQQIQFASALQVYHIADLNRQENRFNSSDTLKSLYDATLMASARAADLATFASMRQEGGIKGIFGKVNYSVYYKLRTFDYKNPKLAGVALPVETNGNEQYLGGRLGFRLDSVTEITGTAEYLLGGFHRIEGTIRSPWLEGYFRNTVSKPGFLQMMYRGTHDFWSAALTGINTTQAKAMVKIGNRAARVKAGGTFTILDHQVYFREVTPGPDGQKVLPFQSTGNQIVVSPELSAQFRFFRHMYFRPQVIYTSIIRNDDNVMKLPLLFVNAQLTYENILFKGHLQTQVGADFHWRSTYQALGYDTSIQSFYVQEGSFSPSYPLVDLFFTGKMGRVRFFVKYNNLIQTIIGTGYLPTPGYPGQRSVLDIGFDFLLFD
ncbi:MAG: putative porin [Cytophagales bacterium]|nr:putative porin [Cytophagales bacterium]